MISLLEAFDETLTARASGPVVVEAVCRKIESACVFPDDKMMLRRIAYVETNDGLDGGTYAPGNFGGIWKLTKSLSSALYSSIYGAFKIDWKTVSYSELSKPFYSGLAARIFLSLLSNNLPRSVIDQAIFWSQNYRTNGHLSTYMNKVNNLNTGCKNGIADIVLAIDGSGSIGIFDFNVIKSFLKNFTSSLNIGSDPSSHSRISVVQFSDHVQLEFDLDEHSTLHDYERAIDNINYLDMNTHTHLALEYLTTKSFVPSAGARSAGVPKIAIVITDGASNFYNLTLDKAAELHQEDITVIAVGVGASVNREELTAIATEPSCRNVFYLDGYFDLQELKDTIEKKTCEAPIYVSDTPLNFTLYANETRNCKLTVTKSGLTVEIVGGDGTVYFSNDTYPTSAFYEISVHITTFTPAVVYFPGFVYSHERYVFCRIESHTNNKTIYEIETVNNKTDSCDPNPCRINQKCVPRKHFSYECVDEYGKTKPTTTIYEFSRTPRTTRSTTFPELTRTRKTPPTVKPSTPFLGFTEIPTTAPPVLTAFIKFSNTSRTVSRIMTTPSFEFTRPPKLTTTQTSAVSTLRKLTTTDHSVESSKYSCVKNNPCTEENASKRKFYFPHDDPSKFVQCSQWGQCFEMSCPASLIWHATYNTCIRSRAMI
ncbi:hypothetical protein HELRODRAFT_177819 [Helobdella robusta]|uniref:VWFA domain-containing protein n=1 Tax=Helobdella robusta TaxID=6412 RepID=T1FCB6_HELRO|nr:hypothetical protein HELRODRAFT_177819 [Helobdella robusta]ESN97757.1 hypothetical protein HELRODRAFT_177819 [Helobdella robusta]